VITLSPTAKQAFSALDATKERNCGRKKSKFPDSLLTRTVKCHLTKALPTA